MRTQNSVPLPPNRAARALRDGQFRAKVVKSKRAYSRKTKHKKGSFHQDAPLFAAGNRAA